MPTRKPIIGLAGGIGSGKSTVARMLADLGCVVADSDTMAKDALRQPDVRSTLIAWWGDGILDETGELDRSRVASIVFSNQPERQRLESLIHPRVEARRRELFASAPADAPALVIDAPLIYEAGVDRECDAVIFVEADPAVRLARVQTSRSWDERELRRREESQLPLDVKRSRAEYTVVNNGDLADLADRVREALKAIAGSGIARRGG
jgi:dephospho-CoA kinase